MKKFTPKTKERLKKWRQENVDKVREQRKRYYNNRKNKIQGIITEKEQIENERIKLLNDKEQIENEQKLLLEKIQNERRIVLKLLDSL